MSHMACIHLFLSQFTFAAKFASNFPQVIQKGPMILAIGAWGLRILVAEVFVRSAALGISLQ